MTEYKVNDLIIVSPPKLAVVNYIMLCRVTDISTYSVSDEIIGVERLYQLSTYNTRATRYKSKPITMNVKSEPFFIDTCDITQNLKQSRVSDFIDLHPEYFI